MCYENLSLACNPDGCSLVSYIGSKCLDPYINAAHSAKFGDAEANQSDKPFEEQSARPNPVCLAHYGLSNSKFVLCWMGLLSQVGTLSSTSSVWSAMVLVLTSVTGRHDLSSAVHVMTRIRS